MFDTKEKIYKNIENLIRNSFEEGTNDIEQRLKQSKIDKGEDPEEIDVFDIIHEPDFKFKSEFLVRSRCFWSIDHFLQYIKMEIEKC